MQYQDWVEPAQAPDEAAASARLSDANINPHTGLATDYLNHFNEAVMLLEMLSASPDCLGDFLAWQPMSYRDHFARSHLKSRHAAIAAYDAADPVLRASLEALADTMTAMLQTTRSAMQAGLPAQETVGLAANAAAWLRPLLARAGAVINGETEAGAAVTPQAIVDGLMKLKA